MITQIDVDSETAFYLPVENATPKDSLLINKVTGLNPPDVNLFIGKYARDGGTYQGRSVANRNVVITLDLNPNYALGETVSGLRQMLYKTFMDPLVEADYLKLLIHQDSGPDVYTVGYAEKFDGELFDVETAVQISMICPDPYLRDNVETVLTDSSGWTVVPFVYAGSAETGFKVSITVVTPTSVLTLENNGKTMVFNRAFAVGDVIDICTIPGSRSLTVTSGGVVSPLIASLALTSPWLQLHSQANSMKVYGATPAATVAVIKSLRYTQAYWGV